MPRLRNRALSDPEAIINRSSRQLAIAMAQTALDAKAEDVVVLDLRKLSYSFDFFVLCSVDSDRHLQTIADDIKEKFRTNGVRSAHEEGQPQGGWKLLDYGPVVVHIFFPDVREFYRLERLWADAPRLPLKIKAVLNGKAQPAKKSVKPALRKKRA
ncbi:MAG: ribosome silencing factor [Candidatus Omnitrophica bacterium]|nr:ribosome silencing factor [Candidatus Omnitrophota bacterium]